MIKAAKDDDKNFIEVISNILKTSISFVQPENVFVIKIDRWFDYKWLQFSGKAVGQLGVWHEKLRTPPFIPDRVIEQTCFQKHAGDYKQVRSQDLHVYQQSHHNLGRKLSQISNSAIFIWYSGESASALQASLMLYITAEETQNAWYVSFSRKHDWQVSKTKNISRSEVLALIENDGLALIR